MPTIEEKIDVMQKFATGKYDLECFSLNDAGADWVQVKVPRRDWSMFTYRVVEKPVERVKVTVYPALFISIKGDPCVSGVHFRDETRAKLCVGEWDGQYVRLLTDFPLEVYEDELTRPS